MKAFKWEPWFSISSPVTVLKVQVAAGIVCFARITHRPLEILGSTLWSQQYQGREFQSIANSHFPLICCGSVSTEADPCAQTISLSGSCGTPKATNSGMSRSQHHPTRVEED
ncbi:hypothetical protein Nmel_005495, partial [Mimus melanotis]